MTCALLASTYEADKATPDALPVELWGGCPFIL
jgi:hypothetical protein